MAFYVGGPLRYVRDAVLANGIPAETTASTTLAVPWAPDGAYDMELTDASDFTGVGALRLTDANHEDYWYTFEARNGNRIQQLTPVFQQKNAWIATRDHPYFEAGTTVTQWYDISEKVTSWKRKNVSGEGESYWVLEISGIGWNSLQIYPDAAILAVATHYDDILGWHDPHIWFSGWLDEPAVRGVPTRNEWQCSAQGRRKYLKLQRNTPGQYGGELVDGTWTGSDPLLDLAAEPLEGNHPSDFAIANISDEDEGSLYISKDYASTSKLTDGPTGTVDQAIGNVGITQQPNSGQGIRITQCYFNPVPTGAHTAQSQKWLVLYNNTQVNVPETPGPPVDILKWGYIDITQFHLLLQNRANSRCGSTERPTVIYLGSKNGGTAASVKLGPQTGAVICFDEAVFRSQFSVPTGWVVYEIKQCAGDRFGSDLAVSQRGVGTGWDPDPAGCWVGLRRGARAGNDQDDARYSARVKGDNVDGDIYLFDVNTNVFPGGLASWPSSGYISSEGSNQLITYAGVDTVNLKLSGCTRIRWNGNALDNSDDNPGGGERIDLHQDASFWEDFVAIGADSIAIVPNDFPVKRVVSEQDFNPDADHPGNPSQSGDGQFVDQNDGTKGEKVWGIWNNAGATPIDWDDGAGNELSFIQPSAWGAQPAARKYAPAVPVMQAIRRSVMGGGVFKQKASGPSWYDHDSNSFADWAVQAGTRIGNTDSLMAFTWLKFHATDHESAYVVEDNSDVNDEDGTLTVQENQARLYPTSSPRSADPWFMRALISGGGHVDFTYENRDGDTFKNVRKIKGTEFIEIPADSTLVTMINTKAAWNKTGASSFIQRNLPISTGISLRRWMALREAKILSVGGGTITVRPGQADGFPASGTLFVLPYVAINIGGITETPASFNPDTFKATYSGRTDSAFTGVTFLGSIVPAADWTVTPYALSALSYPADFDILSSREDNPVDPLTFIDRNESWDVLHTFTFGDQINGTALPPGVIEKFFPFGGGQGNNPFFQWLFIKVHRMSDDGRTKANTLRVHKYPTRNQSDRGDRSALADWQARFTTSELAHDIFLDAGVPSNMMTFSGGEEIRSYRLSEGSIWDSVRGLAAMSSCLLTETSDGKLLFRRDPQASGAPFATNGKLVLDEEAIWGDVSARERPRNTVAQIRLEAKNPSQDQFYTIFSPSKAAPYGTIKNVQSRIAQNEQAAEQLARLLFRRANGGWQVSVPAGPYATVMEYGDVVRFVDDVDAAGRFFAQEMMVTGIEESGSGDRLSITVDLIEWVTV